MPLYPRKPNTLFANGGNAGWEHTTSPRISARRLKFAPGLICLLQAWNIFEARLYHNEDEWDLDEDEWHIYFQICDSQNTT